MGAALFPRYPEQVRAADEVLGYSVEELCLAKDRRLSQTEYTQPALFVVNALTYLEARDRSYPAPTHLLGHSLGELNALHAAGAFDFETGVRIAKKRGELMSSRGEEGTMAALLGKRERLLAFIEQGPSGVYLANDNTPGQVVVSGSREAIAGLEASFRQDGLGNVIPLAVSGAFHSPLMRGARDEFAEFLKSQSLNEPKLPVIANVSATPYTLAELRDHLTDHLVHPVRWFDSIRYLLRQGPMLFQEIGPANILSPLIRQIILPPSSAS
jgi:trans-AT polyketide synthase/acyltransferase/oxidoreductase domain-containing protein